MIVGMDNFLETRQRISLEEQAVRNFAIGYLHGLTSTTPENLSAVDDWVVWHKYELNFIGTTYTSADMDENALLVVVYPRDWMDRLPESMFSFIVEKEK